MARRNNRNRNFNQKINFWVALRDVLIASLNKGQFLVGCAFFVIITVVLKMPNKDVSGLAFEIVNIAENHFIIPYFLLPIVIFVWFKHSKSQRRRFHMEMKRIADSKTEAQENALSRKLESSDN